MSTDRNLLVRDLGHTSYGPTLELQRDLQRMMIEERRERGSATRDILLLNEHNPVITLGRHARHENVLFSPESLSAKGVEVYEIERGGDVTFHGPGQLVAYPIIDLEANRLGVKKYVDLLEEAVIRTIADYGIKGERVEGATGVWIGKGTPCERKICAIGVKCTRFVTMHGLALNVSTNLDFFRLINPCGFIDKGVTSMARELGEDPDMREVKKRFTDHFTTLLDQARNR